MLCVFSHIIEDVFSFLNRKHNIQVNTVIKTLFAGLSKKLLHETLDTFWNKYTKLNDKNDPFESNEFIWSIKDIYDGNSHLWYQKYFLPSTKVLGFIAYRITSKMLGMGSVDCSWGDVKTVKSVKILALGIDIYEKQSIVYISACTEETIIGQLYQTRIIMTVYTVTLGMTRIMPLTIKYINGVLIYSFIIMIK